MKVKVIFISLFFVSFIISSLRSQEVYDLKKAINIAISKNKIISTLENNIEIQDYNIKGSKGNLFPTLSFSGSWNKTNTFSKGGVIIQNGIPIPIGDQSKTQDNYSLALNSQITLFNGFANYESVSLEKQNKESLILELEKTKRDLIFLVNQKFIDVLKKEKIVLTNEEVLKNSKSQLDKIKEYVRVGKKIQADIYRQDVQVAQDELNLESSLNDLKKSKIDLLNTLNENVNKEYTLDAKDIKSDYSLSELKLKTEQYQNTDKLVSAAINNRYDYKKSLQDIKINESKLSIANKNLYFPKLIAFGNYNLSGNDPSDITNSRVFTVGLSLSYPIFQGFQLDVNRQISEVNLKQKILDLNQLQLQIETDIKKATIDLETAYKQIDILERNIIAAEQDVLLSEENFRIGYGTLLDLQTAQVKLNNLKLNRINSLYNFQIYLKQIEYLTGQINF